MCLSAYIGVEFFFFTSYAIVSETHKGLKCVTLTCLLLSDARDYSFSKVPYLEHKEETTDQSNFVNNVT